MNKHKLRLTAAIAATTLILGVSAVAAPTVFNDEAAFRAAAGATTTYGFETHSLAEGVDLPSPLAANQLDDSFDLAYTHLNGFSIDNSGGPGTADGTRSLFTHSVGTASDYTLTFSNFGNANNSITAFGLTITDFASNLTDKDPPVSITYDTGSLTGTLLTVDDGQPDFTQNFVGLVVDNADAFKSITLTLNDNLSGFQWFDEVIYSTAATSAPDTGTTSALFGMGILAIEWFRRTMKGIKP